MKRDMELIRKILIEFDSIEGIRKLYQNLYINELYGIIFL